VRNDYSIWGERNGISGAKIPVHMRYAIDEKPTQYTTINVDNKSSQNGLDPALVRYNNKHGTNIDGQVSETYSILTCDWREIIYRMAQDFYKYAHILDDFNLRVIQANSNIYPTG
jgi:DNA polymerase elongation subunit (family B)